ncbi:MAG: ribonuclease E inhibitor RraB [Rhizomicrobium sp.]
MTKKKRAKSIRLEEAFDGLTENATPTEYVLALLDANGDTRTQIREIDFFAYFPTPSRRAQYIDKALVAGLKLRNTSEPYKPGAGYGAVLFCNDAPEEEAMKKICKLLTGLAEECGGEFDGWETQIVN